MKILVDGQGNTYTMAAERSATREEAAITSLEGEMFTERLRIATQTDLTEHYFPAGARVEAAANLIEDIKNGSLTNDQLQLAAVAAKNAR